MPLIGDCLFWGSFFGSLAINDFVQRQRNLTIETRNGWNFIVLYGRQEILGHLTVKAGFWRVPKWLSKTGPLEVIDPEGRFEKFWKSVFVKDQYLVLRRADFGPPCETVMMGSAGNSSPNSNKKLSSVVVQATCSTSYSLHGYRSRFFFHCRPKAEAAHEKRN